MNPRYGILRLAISDFASLAATVSLFSLGIPFQLSVTVSSNRSRGLVNPEILSLYNMIIRLRAASLLASRSS
jgi:hypothetical protein